MRTGFLPRMLVAIALLALLQACREAPEQAASTAQDVRASAAQEAEAAPGEESAAGADAEATSGESTLSPSPGSHRYALVFGNGAYRHGDALGAPPRDAALMARALGARGYHVLLARDRDLAGMQEDLHAFEAMSKDAELRVLYFAGHGFEFDSANYLMPVDLPANIADLDRGEVRANALRLDQVTASLERGAGPLVVIVDACRVVPARGAAPARPLADEQAPEGTILAFATAPGQVAMDSLRNYGVDEDDSPYTWFLADVLSDPATTTWDQAFRAAYSIVSHQTRGEQQPWMNARVNRFPEIGGMAGSAPAPASASSRLPGLSAIAVSPERRAAARYWAREAEAVRRLARDAVSDVALQRRAGQGDAQAAMALAARWWDVPQREAQVTRLLESAARSGDALAQSDLGTHLYAIRGEDSEGRSARYWWRLASAQGIGEARSKLAILDGNGDADSARELMQGMAEMMQGTVDGGH